MPARLLPHLGRTLRRARESASPRLTREAIATAVGCSLDKVRNLERGRAWPRSPGDADDMVLTYARLTHATPHDMWAEALDRLKDEDAAKHFADAAEEASWPPDVHDASREEEDPGEDEADEDP